MIRGAAIACQRSRQTQQQHAEHMRAARPLLNAWQLVRHMYLHTGHSLCQCHLQVINNKVVAAIPLQTLG